MKELTQKQVQEYLPHRPPLLLVDHVADWAEDAYIETSRTYIEGETVFDGHFPGYPILPGMLNIEAMAQSAGLLVNLSRGTLGHQVRFLFLSLEQAKFRQPVHPGDKIEMKIKQVKRRLDIYKFTGEAWKNGQIAATAEFTAKHIEVK